MTSYEKTFGEIISAIIILIVGIMIIRELPAPTDMIKPMSIILGFSIIAMAVAIFAKIYDLFK